MADSESVCTGHCTGLSGKGAGGRSVVTSLYTYRSEMEIVYSPSNLKRMRSSQAVNNAQLCKKKKKRKKFYTKSLKKKTRQNLMRNYAHREDKSFFTHSSFPIEATKYWALYKTCLSLGFTIHIQNTYNTFNFHPKEEKITIIHRFTTFTNFSVDWFLYVLYLVFWLNCYFFFSEEWKSTKWVLATEDEYLTTVNSGFWKEKNELIGTRRVFTHNVTRMSTKYHTKSWVRVHTKEI